MFNFASMFSLSGPAPLLKPEEPLPLPVQHAVANCEKELNKLGHKVNDGAAIMKASIDVFFGFLFQQFRFFGFK